MEDRFNINQATSYLKGGYKLYCLIDNKKYSFILNKDKVIITSLKIVNRISIYLFKDLYKDCYFFQEENNEEEVDINKDKEYYSWRQ